MKLNFIFINNYHFRHSHIKPSVVELANLRLEMPRSAIERSPARWLGQRAVFRQKKWPALMPARGDVSEVGKSSELKTAGGPTAAHHNRAAVDGMIISPAARKPTCASLECSSSSLFAVRNPDILYLCSMLQEPAAFALLWIEPVNRAAFIREYLLEISD